MATANLFGQDMAGPLKTRPDMPTGLTYYATDTKQLFLSIGRVGGKTMYREILLGPEPEVPQEETKPDNRDPFQKKSP